MRRGFLLPKHNQKRSRVTQPAANSIHPSTEASELAGIVFERHAADLAALLMDSSVLHLCRNQNRKQYMQTGYLHQAYRWVKHLENAMSSNSLPFVGAPDSAILLSCFTKLNDFCFTDEDCKNDDELFTLMWDDSIDHLCQGLEAFQAEALLGIETNAAWAGYHDAYRNTVNNSIKRLMPFGKGNGILCTTSSAGLWKAFCSEPSYIEELRAVSSSICPSCYASTRCTHTH